MVPMVNYFPTKTKVKLRRSRHVKAPYDKRLDLWDACPRPLENLAHQHSTFCPFLLAAVQQPSK